MNNPTCATCRYFVLASGPDWIGITKDQSAQRHGDCRRHAPSAGRLREFPVVHRIDWCGDHAPASPAPPLTVDELRQLIG